MAKQGSAIDTSIIGPAQIQIEAISASKTNPRVWFDPEWIAALADSIETEGLIHRILVRPSAEGFEVVTGECRLRAFQLLRERGCTEICGQEWSGLLPVEVKLISDARAMVLQAKENDERRDVTPIERARGYQNMIDSGEYGEGQKARQNVAAALHVSESTVYQRLQLLKGIPEAQEECAKGSMSENHLKDIARGTPAEQERSLSWLLYNGDRNADGSWNPRHSRRESIPSVRELQAWQRRDRPDLATAPFSTARFDLLPQVSACSDCPKRTRFDADLVGDLFEEDRCLDVACYNEKCKAHVRLLIEEHEKESKPFSLISIAYDKAPDFEGREVLCANDYQSVPVAGITGIIVSAPEHSTAQVGQVKTIRVIKRAVVAPPPPVAENPTLPESEVPAGYVRGEGGELRRTASPAVAEPASPPVASPKSMRLDECGIAPGVTISLAGETGEVCYLVTSVTPDVRYETLVLGVELRSASGQDFGVSKIVENAGVLYWQGSPSGEFIVTVLPSGDSRCIPARTYSDAAAKEKEQREREITEFREACNRVQALVAAADPESQALAVLAWHLFEEFEDGDAWVFARSIGIELPEEEENEGDFYRAILEGCAKKSSGEILGGILASRIASGYQAATVEAVLAKRGVKLPEPRRPWGIEYTVGTKEVTVCCHNDWFGPADVEDFPVKKTLDLTGLIEGTESVDYVVSVYDEGYPAERLLADDRRELYAALREFLKNFEPGGPWSGKPAQEGSARKEEDEVVEVTEDIEEAIDSGKVFSVRPYQMIRTSDGQGPWIVIAVKAEGSRKPRNKKRAVACHTVTLARRKDKGGLSNPQDYPGLWADKDGIHWNLDSDVLVNVEGVDQADDVRELVEAAK